MPLKSRNRTAVALAMTTAMAGAFVAPTASAAPTPQSVLCDDIGQVQAERSSTGWRITDGTPLSVAATGLACRATTSDAQGQVTSTGEALFHVVVDTETVLDEADKTIAARKAEGTVRAAATADPAGYGTVTAFPYKTELANYLATRSGNVAVAYRKAGSQTIYSYYKGRATNVTASIVKVQIMATVMYKAQQQGRGLTDWEKSQMVPMIRVSDNDAATRLWKHVGGAPAVQAVNNRMGLRDTVNNTAWGLTVTTAPDQVVLVDHFARKNPVLNDSMRSYGLSLMRGASSWGVNQGPGTDIAVKNGWLPRTDGWHVNSIGYNHHTPGSYTAAVLTHSASGGLETQKATIAGASRIMYKHRNDSVVQPKAPVRGDWTGDGRGDVLALDGSVLKMWPGSGGGRLGAVRQIGTGWGAMNWIGSPGDINGDGRPDLLARRGDGTLWMYRGTGSGVTSAGQVGHGWGGLALLTASSDVSGDGKADMMARAANGDLLRYRINTTGYLSPAGRMGTGWTSMVSLLPVRGLNTDARTDLLAMRKDGKMFRYYSQGLSFSGSAQVGQGWKPSRVAGPGDLTGDGIEDVVYQTSTGLKTYPVRRGGSFGTPIGTGVSAGTARQLA